jgi:putative effector of murein hydrolase LrgA (UPF0299 family)
MTALMTLAGQVGLVEAIFAVSNFVVTRLHLHVPGNIASVCCSSSRCSQPPDRYGGAT